MISNDNSNRNLRSIPPMRSTGTPNRGRSPIALILGAVAVVVVLGIVVIGLTDTNTDNTSMPNTTNAAPGLK